MPARTSKKRTPERPYFASIAVVVSDTQRALRWYTETLGLEVIDQMDHWVTVGRKGKEGKIHLCQPMESEPKQQLEPGNSGVLIALPGRDFAAACARLKARGVEFSVDPTVESWGTYAMIRDPDGNEHCVMPAP